MSEIVESGGSKRREVFEEAAGVSKFLAQQKDAENKLKRTEDNLLRIRKTKPGWCDRRKSTG